MPVIKIFYDEKLDADMRAYRNDIQGGLEDMMREVLAADPDRCQVIMLAVAHITPYPVYVDLQFRANDHRSGEATMAEAMRRVADAIIPASGSGIRIRAFAIDRTTLYALDVQGKS